MEDIYTEVNRCPWCGHKEYQILYTLSETCEVRRCGQCKIVYSSKVLNDNGLEQYWNEYETKIHTHDKDLTARREKMYDIEYRIIKPFLTKRSRILDAGCGNGNFLDRFHADGHICEGLEFGEEACRLASQKYKCYKGQISDVTFSAKYDLIIFRGVIQYLLRPKKDLLKAVSMLRENGMIYICSSPNADSVCFHLFQEKFTLPVDPANYYMYHEELLTSFFEKAGLQKLICTQSYLGTPYENVYEDILLVAEAVRRRREKQEIDFKSPAFFDNMLTLIYQKTV